MTIGELSRKSGIPSQTLRFYEREGILPAPSRIGSGRYRDFDESALRTLRFVNEAKEAGFTLRQIRELFDAKDTTAECGTVLALINHRLVDVRKRIQQLDRFRHNLSALKKECLVNRKSGRCTTIEFLESAKSPTAVQVK